jgi:hypothetical protein
MGDLLKALGPESELAFYFLGTWGTWGGPGLHGVGQVKEIQDVFFELLVSGLVVF